MPAFKQHGILVYFAAWTKHIGLYPPISGDKTVEKAIAKYAGPKGNLQFPLDEPIPYDLIERIVEACEGTHALDFGPKGIFAGLNPDLHVSRTDILERI